MSTVQTNSEILFIYDAKMTNPNGDMDNENKPRMDYDTDTNLVSDVRLKRYLRDYFETHLKKEIFITNKATDAKNRKEQMKKAKINDYEDLIDVRMFGAVFATKGGADHLTGPIQFNWGYSLNPVEINESSTITSSFSAGEGVGKDFRVKYSLLAFSGSISAHAAECTRLSGEDLDIFDKAMIAAIPANRTRSKMNQTPRLYLRLEMADKDAVLKDLREYLGLQYSLDNPYNTRSITDCAIDFEKLNGYLEKKKDLIQKVHFWKDDNVDIPKWKKLEEIFKGKLVDLDGQA